jgi:hypothetical protein
MLRFVINLIAKIVMLIQHCLDRFHHVCNVFATVLFNFMKLMELTFNKSRDAISLLRPLEFIHALLDKFRGFLLFAVEPRGCFLPTTNIDPANLIMMESKRANKIK